MTLTHTTTFDVRFDECDQYGHVNHAVYLRYMQEAAFRASAEIGYGVDVYEALGRTWYVRETDIEYLSPVHYGARVAVKTWIVDFRRVRTRRAYELREVDSGELIARAVTDWVYLDIDNRRPVTVPEQIVNAYLPEGPADDTPPRKPFPKAPPPPPGLFCQHRHVEWADVDPAGNMSNTAYLRYLEDCAVRDAVSRGWPIKRMLEEGGFAIVARRYRILYLQQALPDDRLQICTWIANVHRVTAERHYTVSRLEDDLLLTRAWARWAWVDLETGRPVRIPQDFIADFAENIVS